MDAITPCQGGDRTFEVVAAAGIGTAADVTVVTFESGIDHKSLLQIAIEVKLRIRAGFRDYYVKICIAQRRYIKISRCLAARPESPFASTTGKEWGVGLRSCYKIRRAAAAITSLSCCLQSKITVINVACSFHNRIAA